jgi:VCBS repeat-containing protein
MEFRKIFIGLGILAVVLSYGALAQQWPFCQSGCTAKDVQVDRVYLVNMRFVGGVYYVDVYADFSVTAANRYCIMVAAGFSSSSDCSNLVTAWRMFGDLSQGTYTNQYVATVKVATRDLWVCRLYAIWRNQPYPGCPTGDCNLYGVGSKCWESTATPYLIRGLDAVDDYYHTAINTPLYVPPPGVLGNDYYPDGVAELVVVSGPDYGTVTLNPDGSFTYTPPSGWSGTASFVYQLKDTKGFTDTATVYITVSPDQPVDAVDDSYSTSEDTPLYVAAPGILGNDSYPDGFGSLAVVTPPAHGSLTLNQDGSFTYTPDPNFCGQDSYIYRLCDTDGDCDEATVTIHVTCVNDAPVAQDDTYTTDEDTPLVVAKPGVLGNDYDVDGDSLTAVLVSGPAHGTLTLNPDGSFTYTPAENFCGEDSFTYKAYDGALYSNVATVTIHVTCVNDAPVANDDEATVSEDSSVTVPVLGNDYDPDGDPLSVSLVSGPTHGWATVNPDGTITYTPNPDFCGTDSFTYQACDPSGACDTATVTITVTCVNDAPVAQDDRYTTAEDTPLLVPAAGILGNDYDVDGDPLTAVLVSGPAHGTLTLNPDGSFTYTPAENFCGEDSFIYKAYDGALYSNVATVRITVTCVNDAPVAQDDSYTTSEDTPLVVPAPGVLGNDYDVDGDPLTSVLVSGPAHGTLALNPDGSFTYTPAENFCGEDSFTYKAYDGALYSNVATVRITVTCVNDAPVAQDDTYTTNEDTSLVVSAPGVLGNDYDVDGDPLTAVLVSGPAHGTLILNPDGSFTYTPAENFCGEDSFTYKAYDGELYSNVATVRITVTCVNDAPVANDDEATVPEDSSVTIPVLGNDYDPDGDPLSVSLVSGPTHGWATVNPDGTITYTPNPDFCGTDSFTYQACDPAGACDTATVTIHVTCVNDAPVAQDDTYTTNEDTPLLVPAPGILGNDYDVDGDPLTSVLVSGPAHGTLTLNPDGSFTYTPAENFCGEDSFTYKAYDGALYSNVATVRITVTCVNDAPVAQDDTYTTNEDTPLVVSAPGVLGNDSDVDGDPLTAVLVSGPAHGTLALNPDGSFTYTPAENFCGEDSFTYKAYDGELYSNVATVRITVTCVNDAPVANDDEASVLEDSSVTIPVLGNDYDVDGDPLSVSIVSGPANGRATVNPDGTITYTPNPDFCGTDSFTYKACDPSGACDTATVTIHVTCVNDAPVARDDSYTTDEDTPLVVAKPGILGNDYDVDGDSLTAVLVSGPAHGTLALNPDGSFTYTPAENFCGEDSFTYKAYDGELYSNVATVRITVTCVNDAPVANDDEASVLEDSSVTIPVLGNDYDVDGDPLSVSLVSGPANGRATVNPDGTITYTPNPDFCGTDSFTYKACDPAGACDTATVTIHVTCVNDAPVANDDEATVPEDSSVTIPVLGNDYDPDGDPLSVSLVSGPTHGWATVNPDGTITYTPNPDFCGTDSFTYQACDPSGACDTATVTIHVTCVNDAPVAQDDTYTTNEDTPLVVAKPGVLGNDYDVDGNELLTSVLVSGPAHGTLTLNPDGSFTYTPNSKFYGTDTFTYRVFDGELYSNVATVTITVSFVNDPMEANDLSLRTCVNEGKAFEVQISDLDILWAGFTGYPVTFELISGPEHGTIAGDWNAVRYEEGAALLTLLYTPDANFIGSDELRIRAFDPYGQFVVFAVRITVESCGLTPAGAAGLVPGPVVIHEIAWAGTSASAEDQWIELRNLSDSPVNLEGWILRWRKKNPKTPEELIWREIRLQGTIEPYGFFLLERGHDDVVKNVHADLIYPTVFRVGDKDLPLLFSVEGDVVELLNEKGELVDTANADPRRLEGWAAGNTLPASMERKSPFIPDLDENWHTNLGIVTFGKDRKENDLTATARNRNEPEILTIAGETLVVERGQKVALSRFVPNAPEAKVVVLRADVAGGAGALVPFDNEAFELRYDELVKTAMALLDTKALEPGAYKVVVTLGAGQYAVFSLVVR